MWNCGWIMDRGRPFQVKLLHDLRTTEILYFPKANYFRVKFLIYFYYKTKQTVAYITFDRNVSYTYTSLFIFILD